MPPNRTTPPIHDTFDVEPDRPLVDAGGGYDAYAVTDRRGGNEPLMAVRVPDGLCPRPLPVGGFARGSVPCCLSPLAFGVARDGRGRWAQFVVSTAPAGPSLAATGMAAPWTETELLETVLYPIAGALAALQARRLPHRAIRPNNVFQSARGQPVTLGCAWAASPGRDQPAAFEPPYSAVCSPAWRSEGVVADDVYALGVLIVGLACGVWPLAELDGEAIVTRKIALGSAGAIIAGAGLPPVISDVVHGMLAEDPDHRPPPALLLNLQAARTRRVAARPRRRAQRTLSVGAHSASDRRGLAHALASEPSHAIPLLRFGAVDQWLRRALGDVSIALVMEEAVRQRAAEHFLTEARADGILLLRAVAALDPLAPLCWHGLRLWPDALGSGLAACSAQETASVVEMLDVEAFAAWAFARAARADPVVAQSEARLLRTIARQRGWGAGMARLRYSSNPLLACRSPVVGDTLVVGLADLLSALERAAERPDRAKLPLDADLAAFVSARLGANMDADFAAMGHLRKAAGNGGAANGAPPSGSPADGAVAALAQLRVLAHIQGHPVGAGAPRLAAWLSAQCASIPERIRSSARRMAVREALDRHVAAGRLADIVKLLENPALLEADHEEAIAAEASIATLDSEIAAIARRLQATRGDARRLGREVVASVGLLAAACAVILAAL